MPMRLLNVRAFLGSRKNNIDADSMIQACVFFDYASGDTPIKRRLAG
jgi:hypothetical protein